MAKPTTHHDTVPNARSSSSPYPYIHPEALHPEHLAVTLEDVLRFLDHFGDERPYLKGNTQAP